MLFFLVCGAEIICLKNSYTRKWSGRHTKWGPTTSLRGWTKERKARWNDFFFAFTHVLQISDGVYCSLNSPFKSEQPWFLINIYIFLLSRISQSEIRLCCCVQRLGRVNGRVKGHSTSMNASLCDFPALKWVPKLVFYEKKPLVWYIIFFFCERQSVHLAK